MARKLNITNEYLNYCDTDKEKEIIETRIKLGSNRKASIELEMNRKTVDRCINRIHNKFVADIEEGLFVKGTSTLYDNEGNIKLRWIKTDKEKENLANAFREVIDEVINELRKEKGEEVIFNNTKDLLEDFYESDILTVYPIGDLHLGMLSWKDETGEDYNTEMSYNLLKKAFERMILSSPNSEKAILANLGDFFHIDDTRNETMRSKNRLDVDTRYPKILKTGLNLITEIITLLLTKHKKIIIRNAIGNHDPHTSYFLNEYIKAWFCNDPRIIIEDEVKTFWFYRFGKNLIGVTHGDTCKMDHLPEIMAADAKDYWSETEFRYWYIGHVHHQQRKEYRTCQVESFGTLAAKDAWHSSSGYRSQRQIKYKVLHKDFGEIQENTVNIKMLQGE